MGVAFFATVLFRTAFLPADLALFIRSCSADAVERAISGSFPLANFACLIFSKISEALTARSVFALVRP
jgi:hypothetical protein